MDLSGYGIRKDSAGMTQSLLELQAFAIPGFVSIIAGPGDLPLIRLATQACRGEIFLSGAHVSSWQPQGHAEVLWLSRMSRFAAGQPIRGGIPLCWPWFGGHPTDKTQAPHGFVRLRQWELRSLSLASDGNLTVILRDCCSANPGFPHSWQVDLKVVFGLSLDVELTTLNTGSKPFSISEAMHTYFSVGDVRQARVEGMLGSSVQDNLTGEQRIQNTDDVVLNRWIQQAHQNHAGPARLIDPVLKRRITIAKRGSGATVIWNPNEKKCAEMAKNPGDLGTEEWPNFVCVEAANTPDDHVVVQPGIPHVLATTISVDSLKG